jgi:2-C-methyl-D-erythritol 4-phosphate cytidylyltransferase
MLKTMRCPHVAAVIVAGGSGTRFGGDKLMASLGDMPVLARTLAAFEASPMINEIVVVARLEAMNQVGQLCVDYGISKAALVVPGGETRALSCYAGVMAVSDKTGIVAIHDGARPLVTEKVIEDAVWGAYRHTAAVPAMPVRDTVKKAQEGMVTETPDRKSLYAVQTPQCFQLDIIRAALTDAVKNAPEVTDDCQAVERIGGQIFLTEGSEENIKITTPLDISLGEVILKKREEEAQE